MKTKTRLGLFFAGCVLALSVSFTAPQSNAQFVDVNPIATAPAAVATVEPTKAAIVVSAPWYADGALIGGLIATVTSFVAIWSHKEKTNAQKVSESLVIAIETASKIPAVAEKEKAFKAAIKSKLQDLGVQPVVDRLVWDLTYSDPLMLSLISAFFTALTAFFQWRTKEAELSAKTAHYDLSRRIESDIHADEDEIKRLRALPDAASQLAADRLRGRVLRAQGVAADLPATSALPGSGPADPLQGGDLHAAGG